jgi:hypothetical protein
MSTLTALARAQAAYHGAAQQLCTVRHLHVHDRPFVLVPLTLAGETNAPLAAMAGQSQGEPHVLVVARPRQREQRFVFVSKLAEILLGYLESFTHDVETLPATKKNDEPRQRFTDAPQVWVPNPGGIEYLRLTGRMTRFRQTIGEHSVPVTVPQLGKWATWFAEQAEYPDSGVLIAATQALGGFWATGQSSLEDGNLAGLMGWIAPPAGMTPVKAAALAEDPILCPPAGPATDPQFDRLVLAPALRDIEEAASEAVRLRVQERLTAALREQMQPTWDRVWQAIGLMRAQPAGGHVQRRWDADRDRFSDFVGYLRDIGHPQSKRDSAVQGARRLHDMERRLGNFEAQRAFDDPLVMGEQRMAGEAFTGTVTWSDPFRTVTLNRRVLRPGIVVETDDPLRLLPGDGDLRDPQRPNQKASILLLAENNGKLAVSLELQGGTGSGLTAPPGTVPAVGERVTYSRLQVSYMSAGQFPDRDNTPWTHGGPPQQYSPATADAGEDWS